MAAGRNVAISCVQAASNQHSIDQNWHCQVRQRTLIISFADEFRQETLDWSGEMTLCGPNGG
jgi:hypothetical protein